MIRCPPVRAQADLARPSLCSLVQIVGNGLVTFEYPSESGERAEGEWECFGYKSCREEYLLRAEQLEKEIKAAGGSVGSAGKAKSTKKKAKKVVESESESD